MPISIHDNLLVSYEVKCQERTITLCTENRIQGKPSVFTNVIFTGVEGYHFENDAFGNIIFELELVPIAQILKEHDSEISQSYHAAGSPGPWAAHLESAQEILSRKGIQGFVLSSSIGLSGWILAQQASVVPS